MQMNKTKMIIWGLVIVASVSLTFDIKISRGKLSDDSVPVKDAEVIRLLRWVVEKELGSSDRSNICQRRVASKRLYDASKYIVDLIQKMGRQTGSAPSGSNGASSYVKNWRDFTANGQYTGEDITRGLIADATMGNNPTICSYLRDNLNTSFGVTSLPAGFDASKYRIGSVQYYKLLNQCTLPQDFNVNKFTNNFESGGGWDVWNQIVKPQNNFYGVYTDTEAELNKQRDFAQGQNQQEVTAGNGYLGQTTCKVIGQNGECLEWNNIKLPANVAAEALGAVIDQNLAWITGVHGVDELPDVYIFEVVNAIFGIGNFGGDPGMPNCPAPFTPPAAEPFSVPLL